MNASQEPPQTLAEAGRAFWRAVVERFDLEVVDLSLLAGAWEMLDRAVAARTAPRRPGTTRPHRTYRGGPVAVAVRLWGIEPADGSRPRAKHD